MRDHGLCRDFRGRKHDLGKRDADDERWTTFTKTNKRIMTYDGMNGTIGFTMHLEFGACLFSNEYS